METEEPGKVEPPKPSPPIQIPLSPDADPLEHVKRIEPIEVTGKTEKIFKSSVQKGTTNSAPKA